MNEEKANTATEEKPARKLKTSLFFPFLRMIRAMNGPRVLQEFTRLQKQADEAKKAAGDDPEAIVEAQNAMGMEIAAVVIEYLPDAEEETMDFLARFTGMTRDELEDQDIRDTIQAVIEVVQDARFADFLRSAVKGTRPNS